MPLPLRKYDSCQEDIALVKEHHSFGMYRDNEFDE